MTQGHNNNQHGETQQRHGSRRSDMGETSSESERSGAPSRRRSEGTGPQAVLIGMPGAGKTRVGKEASSMLSISFRDSDVVLERREGRRISEIFEEDGEDEFRRLECELILDELENFTGVLALGGGAPMTPRTRQALERYVDEGGMVVYLDADPEEMMERAGRSGNRPLLAGDAHARWMSLYAERKPVFEALSTRVIRTHGAPPSVAAQKLVSALRERRVSVGGADPYTVFIGEGCMEGLREVLGNDTVRVALIHTSTVQRHSDHARALMRSAGYQVLDLVIPDAEAGKTIAVANGLWERLAKEGFTRSDAVVGLGGGAATDLAGFVAATWMRGIAYVNCPTSLLAMVDASTGGKTGINTPQGKNLVGSFHTPRGVLADLHTLSTLPNDIFVEGLGEVAKSGFIMDDGILDILDDHADELRHFSGDAIDVDLHEIIAELIERTVTVKARHVSVDLKESGMREFLNYGHTLGHAIEQLEHFTWRHGQAVAVGMVYAAELSHLLGYIDEDLVAYHRELLSALGLRTSWNGGSFEQVLALMHRDKKARGNTLRFIILDRIGHPIHLDNPPDDAVREAFNRIRRP
ncbi:MAG: bifunctional shikimate kinase/3-dehydroquinate synthase [Bifidobacterium crudilactis]|uniref:Multifunctional fusion protein n=2 Tax=Bifidobacterium crudilactis TaxID=327277 RepID=A0A971IDS1_9BIFI|nr:bifunctional shikimate kinase/3-dehydroquinate synthase [Bifidobacterium crudilactis]NLT80242.1 bifunctional shikimate kinase/3-dehydroquinate synthase [Bifidobacterium crudilactis]